jgi:hypothetical protein
MRTKEGRWHDAMIRKQETSPSKAMVAWTAEDIHSIVPHWPIDKCSEWLIDNEESLIKALVSQGFFYIEMMLSQGEHLVPNASQQKYDWLRDPDDLNIIG